jgi:pilus assembly protein Flp/PilA
MLSYLIQWYRLLRNDEEGVTAIEYGLLAALIAVVIIAAVILVGQGLSTTFTDVADNLGATGQ